MKSLSTIFRKKIMPSNHEAFSSKDTKFAFLFFAIVVLILFSGVYFLKNHLNLTQLNEIQVKVFSSCIYSMIFLSMMIILKIRHQGLETAGLQKKGLIPSLIIGSIFICYFIFCYASKNGLNMALLFYLVHYVIFIGFVEEIVFRGFLWGRFYKAFGFKMSIFITGLMFSIAHFPFEYLMYNKTIWDLMIGNVNISLLGGVFFHFIFSFLYSRTNNIVLPAMLHGFLDLFSVLN